MARPNAEPGWELYRTLRAVVGAGTLSGAARELGITQPTVGRQVDALEKSLGVSLFSRSPSGLQPTEAALSLMPHAELMAGAAGALRREASGDPTADRGSVRVTVGEVVGVAIVTPLLTAFREAYPRIAIEVTLTSRTLDLLRREADIGVRLYRPTQTALLARRLGVIETAFFAHEDYLRAHGTPRTMRDLTKHSLVGFDTDAGIRSAQKRGMPFSREALAFRCDSYVAQQAAVEGGFGIGRFLIATAREKGLVRVLPNEPPESFEVWLVMHEGQRMTRRVRLLYDYLVDAISASLAAMKKKPRRA